MQNKWNANQMFYNQIANPSSLLNDKAKYYRSKLFEGWIELCFDSKLWNFYINGMRLDYWFLVFFIFDKIGF